MSVSTLHIDKLELPTSGDLKSLRLPHTQEMAQLEEKSFFL